MHEIDSEYEFIDEENVDFIENIIVEYQCLIEKFLKTNNVVDFQKSKINMLCEEKIKQNEKIRFLDMSIHISLRETIF